MVDSLLPNSSKRAVPVYGDSTIRFAPGQEQTAYVFDNVPDIIDFIRSQTDSSITVYVDLTAVGGSFTMPVRTDYDFRRVYLDGFFNDDGTIPSLVWPDGAKIVDDCDFIRKKDVDFQVECTTTTPWSPNKPSRMEDEAAAGYLATSNSCPFVSTSNMGSDLLTYQGGPGCGLFNFGGSEIVNVAPGTTFRAFTNEDSQIQGGTISTGDSTSVVDVRMSTQSLLGAQPNLDPTNYTVSCAEQGGSAFPDRTYEGKLWLRTDRNREYYRNSEGEGWEQLAVRPASSQNTNTVSTTSLVATHNTLVFNVENIVDHKVTIQFFWGGSNTAKNFNGILDMPGVINATFHIEQPRKSDGGGIELQKLPATIEYNWTPVVAGPQTINLQFSGEDDTTTVSVYNSIITVEEVK